MDAKSSQRPPARAGFTLVELLVVIIIITMLAGLAITGGNAALKAARRAVISSEIQQMSITLDKYKTDCGDYPPDCFCIDYTGTDTDLITAKAKSQNAVLRHFHKRFPRYRPGKYTQQLTNNNLSSVSEWDKLRLDAYNSSSGSNITNPSSINASNGVDLDCLNPSAALAFFIGGMPDDDGKPSGFSANPSNPFAPGGSRTAPLFELDETRFVQLPVYPGSTEKVYKYVPKYIKNPGNSNQGVPYVYFRPRSGAYGPRTLQQLHSNTAAERVPVPRYPLTPNVNIGVCLPYAKTTVTTASPKDGTTVDWYAGKKFQIIAAGLPGEFGTTDSTAFNPSSKPLDAYRYFNTDGNNMNQLEDDNLSSFTPGRIGDGVQ